MDRAAVQLLQSASLAGLPESKAQQLRRMLQRQLATAREGTTPEASLLANAQGPHTPAMSQVQPEQQSHPAASIDEDRSVHFPQHRQTSL